MSKITLPSTAYDDKIAWHYSKKGLFKMKSAYRLDIQEDQEAGPSSEIGGQTLWRDIWKMQVPRESNYLRGVHSKMAFQ